MKTTILHHAREIQTQENQLYFLNQPASSVTEYCLWDSVQFLITNETFQQ